MFKAIEQLGQKLQRVEDERDRLARRLALIESAATLDEKTGKYYLPVVVDREDVPAPATPRWMVAASLSSSVIALLSLVLVLTHEPASPLSSQQIAALNALTTPRFAQFEDKSWKNASDESARAEKEKDLAAAEQPPALPQTVEPAAGETPAPVVAAEEPKPAPRAAPEPEKKTVAEAPEAKPAPAPAPETKVAEALPPPAPEKIAEAKPAETKPVEAPKETASAELPKPSAEAGEAAIANIAPDTGLPAKLAELEKSAFAGTPEAQHDLATLYASGKIVAQDYKRAAYWFSRAADGGIANADYNLGVLFQQGLGVKKDLARALAWYQRAAELGHPEAMYNLGIAYIEGVGTDRDVSKGVSYFKSAANAGVAQAAYNLGVLYESNFIGPVDLDKASDWYQVAANSGHAEAQAAVARIKTQLGKAEDQVLSVADLVEPAAGDDVGEGDPSPASESKTSVRTALISRIQDALIKLNLLPPPPSGKLDAPTQDAIRAWQSKKGMKADGQPSQDVLDKMTAEAAAKKN
jgi:TPR repeat protein